MHGFVTVLVGCTLVTRQPLTDIAWLAKEPTLRTIVAFSKSSMAWEILRFLCAVAGGGNSCLEFRDPSELGVRIPDL